MPLDVLVLHLNTTSAASNTVDEATNSPPQLFTWPRSQWGKGRTELRARAKNGDVDNGKEGAGLVTVILLPVSASPVPVSFIDSLLDLKVLRLFCLDECTIFFSSVP